MYRRGMADAPADTILAELAHAERAERRTRALLATLELPLLKPGDPDYTPDAANARAALLLRAALRILEDPNRSSRASSNEARAQARASRHTDSDLSIPIPIARIPFARSPVDAQRDPTRTANVSERIPASASSLPSPTVHPSGVLPDLPLASSLNDDANSTSSPLRLAHSPLPSSPRSSDSSAHSAFSSPPPSSAFKPDSPSRSPRSASSQPLRLVRSPLPSPPRSPALSADSVVPAFLPTKRARDRPAA